MSKIIDRQTGAAVQLATLQQRAPLYGMEPAGTQPDDIAIGHAAAMQLAVARARLSGRRQIVRSAFADDPTLRRFFAVQAWR